MSNENVNPDPPAAAPVPPVAPVPPAAPAAPTPPAEEQFVKLAPEAYNALLDRLDELEGLSVQGKKPYNVEDLANSGQKRQQSGQQLTDEDLNEMKPAQLIQLVSNHINETQIRPLLIKIEEMNVRQEINEIMKDPKNADFIDLREEIYKIASANPTLSLKQAYKLAKDEQGSTQSPNLNTKDHLRGLPPRRVISGERPSTATVATDAKVPETRVEAATQALAELKKAGKFRI